MLLLFCPMLLLICFYNLRLLLMPSFILIFELKNVRTRISGAFGWKFALCLLYLLFGTETWHHANLRLPQSKITYRMCMVNIR
jgi:hypothetical protein